MSILLTLLGLLFGKAEPEQASAPFDAACEASTVTADNPTFSAGADACSNALAR